MTPAVRTTRTNRQQGDDMSTTDQTNIVSHGACGKTWHQSGNRTSHCGGCHETFASLSVFESHRRDQKCLAPEDVRHNRKRGIAQRPDGIWYSPADAEDARAHFGNGVEQPDADPAGDSAEVADIAAQGAVA